MTGTDQQQDETRYGPAEITCPYCLEEITVEAGPTKQCEITHCEDGKWIIVDLVEETAGKSSGLLTDGGQDETPRVKRVECGICEQAFTNGDVVSIAQAVARHWNEEHGDELAVDMTPFKTEEVGGHHLHGDEYAYELKEYYVTAYDVLDKSGATCGPFSYAYVKEPEGEEFCEDCGIHIRNADGYSEIDDSGWRTKYRCDACERERNIRRRRQENQSIDAFGGSA